MTNGRTRQKKGKGFQHAVARCLAYITGLTFEDFVSNHGGKSGEVDIYRSREARRRWPFRTETKNCKALSLPEWIRKLDADAMEDGCSEPGIIVYKLFRTSRVRVDLDFEEFLNVMYGPLSYEMRTEIRNFIKKV